METKIPIRDIMTKKVITVDVEMNAVDISKKMMEKDVGCVIVVKNDKPVGIVSERDIVRKLVSTDVKSSSMTAEMLMTEPIVTVSDDTSLLDTTKKMAKNKIRRLPVMSGDKMVGIVSETDVVSVSSEMDRIRAEIIEMSRERASLREGKTIPQGICEKCGQLAENLETMNGVLICEDCRDELFR
ncbi:MAG: CBS domain-containing protein [Halobacteriota archaeon]|nr:CBS domain-containing protein [Halobacteriota archaeon]